MPRKKTRSEPDQPSKAEQRRIERAKRKFPSEAFVDGAARKQSDERAARGWPAGPGPDEE
jgi:hypothetical protein